MNIKQTSTHWLAGIIMMTACIPAMAAQEDNKVLHDSERMIDQCLKYASSQKYPPMSVAIIDASGTLVAFKRQDGASQATAEAALLKAKTSVRLGASTADLGPAIGGGAPTRDAFIVMQLTTIPGGVPITDEAGHVTGAVGVSGGAPEQDTKCSQLAVEAPAKKGKQP